MRRKRTNLELDENLIAEANRLSGEKIDSAAVTLALAEFVRPAKARRILEFRGSGLRALGSGLWALGRRSRLDASRSGDEAGSRVILVDPSVWIATFRIQSPLDLKDVLDIDEIVTCLPVAQEV